MLKVIPRKFISAFIAILFILPIFISNSAHADTFRTEIDVTPRLNVTVPTTPTEITVNPSSNNFRYKDLQIKVSTNNPTGYYTTVSAETTNLIKKEDSSKFIPTIEEAGYYSEYGFPTNRWGYALSSTSYKYQPFVSGATIANKDTAANGDNINMRIATKVDYLQSPGTYEIELNFLTVVNYLPPSYIQDVDPMTCLETPRTVVDMRDGQEYTIQKLADGRCWMVDNLNLGAVDITNNLTPANTNINETVTADTFNGWRKSGSGSSYTSGEFISVSGIDETAQSDYGTLYNYCAASAGTYCMPSGSGSGNSTYDLCPAGWRLPKGGQSEDPTNEYKILATSYDSIDKLRAPISEGGLAFTLAGYFQEGTTVNKVDDGYYWTSTYNSPSQMHRVDITPTFIYYTSQSRAQGYPIRCILDEPDISEAHYLQDVKRAMVYKMNVGDTVTLLDKRDNESYVVGKLADGRLWMLDNLRLDPTAVSLEDLQGNTNAPDEALGYLKNGGGTGVYPADAVQTTTSSYVSWDEPFVITYDKDRVVEGTTGLGSGKSGVYYNWCAASAGTLCYAYDEAPDYSESSYDICPKGWKIPSGGSRDKGEWGAIYQALSMHDPSIKEALSITINAFTNDEGGWYWTSTHSGTSREMYIVEFRKGENSDQTDNTLFIEDKDFNSSQSVRCILKN